MHARHGDTAQRMTRQCFAKRILPRIIAQRPIGCKFVHIVADRYDGMQGYGVSLREASGCRNRRNESDNQVIYQIEDNLPIANWNQVFMLCQKQTTTDTFSVQYLGKL